MIEQRLVKVDPDSPDRCQSMIRNAQCPFGRAEGNSKYCKIHEGASKAAANPEKASRNYRLAIWQTRVNEFADNDQIKSLREEIGILRLSLEATLNKCHDEQDLLLYSTKIADNILKIEKLVASCHRLEQSTSTLLDKTTVIQIASIIVTTISKYIDDPDILDNVSNEIIDTILATKKQPAL